VDEIFLSRLLLFPARTSIHIMSHYFFIILVLVLMRRARFILWGALIASQTFLLFSFHFNKLPAELVLQLVASLFNLIYYEWFRQYRLQGSEMLSRGHCAFSVSVEAEEAWLA